MRYADTWSPDEPLGTEVFEQADEAASEGERLDPELAEASQLDPELEPSTVVDELELEEIGVEFDDPEMIATLSGGMDDPDGVGSPRPGQPAAEGGAEEPA